jgi:hypothetical protein
MGRELGVGRMPSLVLGLLGTVALEPLTKRAQPADIHLEGVSPLEEVSMKLRPRLLAYALGALVLAAGAAHAQTTSAVMPPRNPSAPPLPAYPEPRVRAWQVGVLRSDRLQHLGFTYTLGVMSGITAESPVAAAGTAFGMGLAKELWDRRTSGFDPLDLLADALGAAGAAATTVTLTR